MEKLIHFQYKSEPNAVALFEAVSAPISRPQIFAGHYRGEDFNLVTDVGSRAERHKRSLCSSKGFTGNSIYHLGRLLQLPACTTSVVSYKLLVMEVEWRPHLSKSEQTVIGATSIWYRAFNLRSLMWCHLKSLNVPGILRRWHFKKPPVLCQCRIFCELLKLIHWLLTFGSKPQNKTTQEFHKMILHQARLCKDTLCFRFLA